MEVSVPAFGLGLVGLYVIPHHRKAPALKPRYWGALLAAAEQRRARPFLLVGDFNTGAHYQDEDGATFRCADQFKRLTQSGSRWFDAWRHFAGERREYTWYSRKGGFRLDHAFVSEPLVPRLAACWYSHDEREQKVSDHSILLVELNTT
jgi:exonuclease III